MLVGVREALCSRGDPALLHGQGMQSLRHQEGRPRRQKVGVAVVTYFYLLKHMHIIYSVSAKNLKNVNKYVTIDYL